MNKEEMICKNCKYHYIEEISFDYPQSCCDKRKAVIEEWFNCNDFEYSDKYIEQLQQQCKKQKEVIDKANKKLNNFIDSCKAEKLESGSDYIHNQYWDMFERFNKQIKDILKEVK